MQRNKQGFPMLEVTKNRFDGQVGKVSLTFDPKSLRYYEHELGEPKPLRTSLKNAAVMEGEDEGVVHTPRPTPPITQTPSPSPSPSSSEQQTKTNQQQTPSNKQQKTNTKQVDSADGDGEEVFPI
eukprot:TRINITY_DN3693_c0_g1_i11.p4 TRINITY_DN3693_c0_g1~~TRINITY_DN3693_c0_g1_i11.p4  ORF type:complete len:125 (-),score=44.34 TRINITY_DN3693_c0_g1_i11:1386-1760(-)